jgi:hypothetical protein
MRETGMLEVFMNNCTIQGDVRNMNLHLAIILEQLGRAFSAMI